MSNSIKVKSAAGLYEAVIGNGVLKEEIQKSLPDYNDDTIFTIIDENVNRFHSDLIDDSLNHLFDTVHKLIIPEGEESKSILSWSRCVDFLLKNGIRRNTPVLVIGGGVTGDLGGFAAASVLRGVPLFHIPTTLLSMVDSSIGGKTGINHHMGKNLVGAFYQPKRVIADVMFLETLPENEWINGLSEILKYGAIRDRSIIDDAELFLKDNFKSTDPQQLIGLISKCVQVKADIVKEDEFESGVRAFLNFGHTFAHALERSCGYSKISHGEAVYLGMQAACKLSSLTGSELESDLLEKFSSLYNYRVSKEELSYDELLQHMNSDKKKTDQFIRFVLLKTWQHPVLKTVNDNTLIRKAWEAAFDKL
jgi:3-dehydroquinate synthase